MLHLIPSLKSKPVIGNRKFLWLIAASIGTVILVALKIRSFAFLLNPLTSFVPWESLSGALVIFGLRLTDVPIGTLKTVLMVRGMRTWATILGLLEVTIWLTAMGRVMDHLDNPWNIGGYALGYSAGTWLGMWLESRLAFGSVEVHTISMTHSAEVAEVIRAAGYGVTQFQGYGQSGPVCIVGTIAERKHLDNLLKRIHAVDPNAFVTVDDSRQVVGGYRPGK